MLLQKIYRLLREMMWSKQSIKHLDTAYQITNTNTENGPKAKNAYTEKEMIMHMRGKQF